MTIVVAYADTPPGRAALQTALGEAALRSEDVVLVPAVRDQSTPDLARLADQSRARFEALTTAGGKVTAESGDLADPADSVIQVAQRHDASMIVLGLRKRSPVGKTLLGSTAQRILLDATCPVLGVKPPRSAGRWGDLPAS